MPEKISALPHEVRAHKWNLPPAAEFAGDELIEDFATKYCAAMQTSYTQLMPAFTMVAERVGMPLGNKDYERILRFMAAASHLDDALDRPDDTKDSATSRPHITPQQFKETLENVWHQRKLDVKDLPLNEAGNYSVLLLFNAVKDFDESRLQTLKFAAEQVANAVTMKSNTTDVGDYIKIITNENIYFGELITGLIDDYSSEDNGDKLAAFKARITAISVLGGVLDSAIDLQMDFDHGVTKVRPNKTNKHRMLIESLRKLRLAAVRPVGISGLYKVAKAIKNFKTEI